MRKLGRKLLIAGLVALYGGISLLGYGLHELAPAHHHGPPGLVASHRHSHDDDTDHDHRHAPVTNAPTLTDSHACEICIFLAQIRSERPPVLAEVVWQHRVADAVIAAPPVTSQTVLGLHIPRGPPTLVG